MIFRHRRLFCLSLFAIFTVFVIERLPHAYKGSLFWAVLALALLSLCLCAWKRRFLFFGLALLLTGTALFSSYRVSFRQEAVSTLAEETADMTVTVECPHGEGDGGYLADGRLSLLWEGKTLSLPVKVRAPIPLEVGDVVFGEACFTPAEKSSYLAACGFYGTVKYLDECQKVDRLSSPTLSLSRLRNSIALRIRSFIPNENGELLCALLIGVRDGLPDTFTRDMGRIGTTHMLSLSGMHLVVLTAGIAFLLKRMRLGKHLRVLLLAAFVVFFMLLTGLSPSVMRAGFMFLFSALPLFMREERDSLSSLLAAVALILLWEPYAVRDLSLWLSALATLGILLFFDRKRTEGEERPSLGKRIFGYIAFSLSVTLSATLATLPLTLCAFGTIPLLSPIANLLLAPLVQVALYLALGVSLLGWIPAISAIASSVCKLVFTLSGALSDIPHTILPPISPLSLFLIFLLFALLLAYFSFAPRKRFSFRVPVLLCLCFSLSALGAESVSRLAHHDELTLSYYSEESDALLFTYRGERLLAVFSDLSQISFAESEALDAVAGELDGFFLPFYAKNSVPHIRELLETQKVFALYLPTPGTAREIAQYEEILAISASCGTRVLATEPNKPFFFGTLTAVPVCKDTKSRALCFEFLFGYNRIQYYSGNALNYGLDADPLGADVLILGAYGDPPKHRLPREDFISPDTTVLCGEIEIFPFENAQGIVFSRTGTVYIPSDTSYP